MRMVQLAENKRTEAEREEAQCAGGIKSELAILHQSTNFSKLLNGILDVASTLRYALTF